MIQFLRETWELWYWALFRPSLLQQRMNAWAPRIKKDGEQVNTAYGAILLFSPNMRFLSQFAMLSLLLCLPLIVLVAVTGEMRDWLFVLTVGLSAYGLAWIFLPAGLLVPLLWTLVYAYQHQILYKALDATANLLPSFPHLAFGTTMYTVGLVLSALAGSWLWRRKQIWAGRIVLAAGILVSVVVGGWLATRTWQLWAVADALIGVILFSVLRNEPKDGDPDQAVGVVGVVALIVAFGVAVGVAGGVALIVALIVAFGVAGVVALIVAFGVAGVVAGGVALIVAVGVAGVVAGGVALIVALIVAVGVAGVVAVGVAGGVAGVSLLPLPPLLLVAWFVSFSLAPLRWRWSGLLVAGVFVALTFQQQGWWAIAVGVAALAGSYRLLSLYSPFALLSLAGSIRLSGRTSPLAMPLLHRLPPVGDEVLWLPLLGHSRILAAAFHEDAGAALATLQQMRAMPYPGYQYTVRRALPQIVADQLAQVQTIDDLVATAQADPQLLSQLVPVFYQRDESGQRLAPAIVPGSKDEIDIVLPRLLSIADDTDRALEVVNPALVERGLDRCLINLRSLQGQLPGLGLKRDQISCWQPVFAQWERVIQQEIAHQRTLSQGELPNPFQTGNPLRPERKGLFKGRTQFANDVLRYVYDASRPTLVLHGPRRCGKSSFLLNLPRLLPRDVLPVYYSLQTPAATAGTGDFCYGLVRAMGRDLGGQGVVTPEAARAGFQDNPYAALEDWLDKALSRLEKRSVLLCFDEFERLGMAVAEGRVSLEVFEQLRDLIQHSSLSFLFCGVQTLEELGPNWSSYFISVQPMEMTYLEADEARELLTNPDPAFDLRYAEDVVDQVVATTRCHPYLLQLIGEQMVRQANRNQTRLLTPPLLEAALDAALTAGEPYFTNLWTEYTGRSPDEVCAGQVLLHAIAHGQPLPPTDTPAARAALRRLVRYHVVEHINGTYRCDVPFVARWVRERAVLDGADTESARG